MYIYIDIRDLTLHFVEETVILDTTHDSYDPNDIKILTPDAFKLIFNKIKENVDYIRDLEENPRDITESIKKKTQNIKDLNKNVNIIMNRVDDKEIKNQEQAERLKILRIKNKNRKIE
jgi:hypothetical protein